MINSMYWLGVLLFAISPMFQAFKSIKQGHSLGVSFRALMLGMTASLVFLYYTYTHDYKYLMYSVVADILFRLVVLFYKAYPRYRKFYK